VEKEDTGGLRTPRTRHTLEQASSSSEDEPNSNRTVAHC